MNARMTVMIAFVAVIVSATDAYPCTRVGSVSSVDMVKEADAIVRATAVEYAVAPRNPNVWTTGEPDSTIRCKVLEFIRGAMPSDLILPGYLVHDDYLNGLAPPYTFVRPNGRRGQLFRQLLSFGWVVSVDTQEETGRGIYGQLVRAGSRERATSLQRRSVAPVGSGTSQEADCAA